jgi:hypothetical protein
MISRPAAHGHLAPFFGRRQALAKTFEAFRKTFHELLKTFHGF